jgi:hypothetical protein
MRGLQTIATRQRLIEGIEFLHAVRRGYTFLDDSTLYATAAHGLHEQARMVVSTVERVAWLLRTAR